MKSILVWNSVHRYESGSDFGRGSEGFVKNGCPVSQCQLIFNRKALNFEQYDAVIMNMFAIYDTDRPEDAEANIRTSHQRYIFLSQESPSTLPIDTSKFRNYFNWTMSYRQDSDIKLSYGRVRAKSSAPQNPSEMERLIRETHKWNRTFPTKTKTVVWMVSHCATFGKREGYVQELNKYIQVDVYGGCGKLKCPRNESHWISDPQCYHLLSREYKFYLPFENSVCTDYVTEKFFEILAHDLVPVVYGGANYSKLAPPHSFIDAMKLTPLQLARYLHKLSSNDTLYNEYFWWKEHYTVEAGMEQMVRRAYCDLCRKLHEDSAIQTYDDVDNYWALSQCETIKSWAKYSSSISNSSKNDENKIIGWPKDSLYVPW